MSDYCLATEVMLLHLVIQYSAERWRLEDSLSSTVINFPAGNSVFGIGCRQTETPAFDKSFQRHLKSFFFSHVAYNQQHWLNDSKNHFC